MDYVGPKAKDKPCMDWSTVLGNSSSNLSQNMTFFCYQSLGTWLLRNVWTNCAGYVLNSGLCVLYKNITVTYPRRRTLDSELVLSYNIRHFQVADELNVLA